MAGVSVLGAKLAGSGLVGGWRRPAFSFSCRLEGRANPLPCLGGRSPFFHVPRVFLALPFSRFVLVFCRLGFCCCWRGFPVWQLPYRLVVSCCRRVVARFLSACCWRETRIFWLVVGWWSAPKRERPAFLPSRGSCRREGLAVERVLPSSPPLLSFSRYAFLWTLSRVLAFLALPCLPRFLLRVPRLLPPFSASFCVGS